MGLKLNATNGGGSVELDVPNTVNSDFALTVPAAAGTIDRLERAGNILQVVQASTDTEVEVTTTTFTDTGLTATITPTSTSSKILVLVNQQVLYTGTVNGQGAGIKVLRDSTEIYSPPIDSSGPFDIYSANFASRYTRLSVSLLDAPASTSSITYKTQGRPYYSGNSGKVEFQTLASVSNATSFMILIEVAG